MSSSLAPRPRLLALAAAGLLLGSCQLTESLVSNMFKTRERSGPLINGKQEGSWVFRYESGATKAKGDYENDHQIGHWVYYYENGNIEWEGEFDDARISGPSMFGHENGKRRAVGLFHDGFEEDLWTFWSPDGSLASEGDYIAGTPALRWTYFGDNGKPIAEGYRLDGERVGPWQFYRSNGEVAERRFGLPEGMEIVHETWDGVTPRREGFLLNGKQTGRWVTWHPNGRRRTTGDFVDGTPSGLWIAWTAGGQPVARGKMVDGMPTGEWLLWRNGKKERVNGAGMELTSMFSGTWSEASAPTASPEQTLATWIGESASLPAETIDLAPDPNVPTPTPEEVAATDQLPRIPLRSQPWTVRETDSLDFLVARYSDGAKSVEPPRGSGYGRRRGRSTATDTEEESTGDPVLSPRFLGTTLPWTRFYRATGEVVDLDDHRGKSKVVLVVLRGFAREVCVYCVTQTEALCDNIEGFKEAGCEVYVVYPGDRNRLEAFMESFRNFSKHMGEPPLGVLYDRNMELVERMGITSELAIPSTFVIDERGVIRYSYVGIDVEDRPSAEQVLTAIRAMDSP